MATISHTTITRLVRIAAAASRTVAKPNRTTTNGARTTIETTASQTTVATTIAIAAIAAAEGEVAEADGIATSAHILYI